MLGIAVARGESVTQQPAWRGATGIERFTVQPVPAAHPYCHNILPLDLAARPEVRNDPPVPGAPDWQWWPPQALDAAWLAQDLSRVPDVLHIHFGFEHYTPEQLTEALRTLHASGGALVLTVHDLENPHLEDQTEHLARLDVLVPAAQRVLTLTEGAAELIRERWGREAAVVPHPHLLPLEELAADLSPRGPRSSEAPIRLGLHAKDLRAALDPLAVMDGLSLATKRLQARGHQVDVRIDVQPNVRRPELLDQIREEAQARGFRIWQHERLDDHDLAQDLLSLDVSVLAYGQGTHSGWIELCRDLGVPVAISNIGFVGEQGTQPLPGAPNDAPSHVATFTLGDAESFADAVDQLLARQERIIPATRAQRTQQRAHIAQTHLEAWTAALAEVRS